MTRDSCYYHQRGVPVNTSSSHHNECCLATNDMPHQLGLQLINNVVNEWESWSLWGVECRQTLNVLHRPLPVFLQAHTLSLPSTSFSLVSRVLLWVLSSKRPRLSLSPLGTLFLVAKQIFKAILLVHFSHNSSRLTTLFFFFAKRRVSVTNSCATFTSHNPTRLISVHISFFFLASASRPHSSPPG
jgi:hypothetical protein